MEDDKTGGLGIDVQGAQALAYSPEFCFQTLDMTSPRAGEGARLSASTSSLTHAYGLDNVTYAVTETSLDTLSVHYCTALTSATRIATSCGTNGACVQVGTLRSGESHVDSAVDAVTGFQNGGSSGSSSSGRPATVAAAAAGRTATAASAGASAGAAVRAAAGAAAGAAKGTVAAVAAAVAAVAGAVEMQQQ